MNKNFISLTICVSFTTTTTTTTTPYLTPLFCHSSFLQSFSLPFFVAGAGGKE